MNMDFAASEARRFVAAVEAYNIVRLAELDKLAQVKATRSPDYVSNWYDPEPHVEHAAVRRASMDLTRALAKMRAS